MAIHTLWGAPAMILVVLALLYQQVGWATFVGLVVMLMYSPVSSKCGDGVRLGGWQAKPWRTAIARCCREDCCREDVAGQVCWKASAAVLFVQTVVGIAAHLAGYL